MDSTIYIRGLGIFFIIAGILVKLGVWKSWFWRSRGGVYAYIPMGIAFILYSYIPIFTERGGYQSTLYILIFLLTVALAIYFSLKPPVWMKPKWVHWTEKYPQSTLKAIKQAVVDRELDWKGVLDSEETTDQWIKKFMKTKHSAAPAKNK